MKFQNLKISLKNSETFLGSLKFVKIPSTTPSHFQAWFEIEVFQLILATPDVTQQNGVLQICSKECRIRARWFIDKNNSVYKTERKETIHMLFFTTSNLKSGKAYKSRRVLLSRKIIYSGISIFILQFPYTFHILCAILTNVNFHTVPSMFLFLFSWSHLKASAAHSRDPSLFRERSIMGKLNIQAEQLKMKSNTPWVT